MKPLLVVENTREDYIRLERLKESVEIYPIHLQELAEAELIGHYLVVAGDTLPRLGKDLQENLLIRQIDLLLIPPYPRDDIASLIPTLNEARFRSIPFSSSIIADEKLKKEISLERLEIFFQKAVSAKPSRPLIVVSTERPVLVYSQFRSTWGRLLITSLLLTSLSARSNGRHKSILWSGLTNWLKNTAPTPMQPPLAKLDGFVDRETDQRVLILAIHLAHNEEVLTEQDLTSALERIRIRLSIGKLKSDPMKMIQNVIDTGILKPNDQGGWQVDTVLLSYEINRMHLTSYIRRLD